MSSVYFAGSDVDHPFFLRNDRVAVGVSVFPEDAAKAAAAKRHPHQTEEIFVLDGALSLVVGEEGEEPETDLNPGDDVGMGETTGPLDTNADSDSLKYTAANLEGRIQITAIWNGLQGVADRVEYGTYGGSDFDRDGLSVPARSDTALRTTFTYNTDGTVHKVEDPKALVTKWDYDAEGRRTEEIRHYDANVNSGNPSGTDDNVTVTYAFTDGLMTSMTADLPAGETDQTTTYAYGTTKGTSAGDSKIGTGHLLQKVTYPDSAGGTDVVTYAYNALGERIWQKDQAGNVLEWDLDTLGRETHERVTTLANGFDGAVRRISTTYTSLGQVELVTQYDNATVGSGSVVNEAKSTYDGWGNVEKYEEDRDSGVGAQGSVNDYEVSYTYAKATGGRNTVRRTGATLPSGNVLTYEYVSTSSHPDDKSSRVTRVKDDTVTLAEYKYLGTRQVVGILHDEADIFWKMYSTAGNYPDLDRFNRVTSSRWTKDLATDNDFYDVDLTYDRNSNITLAEDNVHAGFDVSYTIDDIDRVARAQEGTWNGSSITSETRDQEWTLSQTGNWELAKLDLNGDGDWGDSNEYQDDRTHNAVNELTARDVDDNGTDDYTLTYDAVGNLTDDGQSYTWEWDAFGRLRKVKNRSTAALVAEYTYNGLGHRIGVHQDTEPDGDVDGDDLWYFTAYDEGWRVLATFRSSDTSPKEEFILHQAGLDGLGGSSYINAVVCRDKDANTAWTAQSDGTLEQRYYYAQNWRGDVVALVTSGGALVETPRYSAYGIPIGLPAGDTDSDGDCDTTDVSAIATWRQASQYDLRGDLDLDGDVDLTDENTAYNNLKTLAWGVLTDCRNRFGYAGYDLDPALAGSIYHVRHRVLHAGLGRWTQRDPLGYVDGVGLYAYVGNAPGTRIDPLGLQESPWCDSVPGFWERCKQVRKWYKDEKYWGQRHCTNLCRLTARLGGGVATGLGVAWEAFEHGLLYPFVMEPLGADPLGAEEWKKDIFYYNVVGVRCGREGNKTFKDCWCCCCRKLSGKDPCKQGAPGGPCNHTDPTDPGDGDDNHPEGSKTPPPPPPPPEPGKTQPQKPKGPYTGVRWMRY
ncbi:MAG: RHS repeat-associated core domain-containing protein [Planctomycetota bacterium]